MKSALNILILLAGVCVLGAASCNDKTEVATPPAPPTPPPPAVVEKPAPPPPPKEPVPAPAPEKTGKAPDVYRVKFDTSRGEFTVEVHRDWAPNGADRFYELVKGNFYDGCRFFRVVSGFMAQFGIHGDPAVSAKWLEANIKDDPVKQGNTRGRITFAMRGPNTRTTQVFINFRDNSPLNRQGFASFGEVVQGMEIVDALHSGYGDGPPRGRGPDQGRLTMEGNAYLERDFKNLDFIKTARIAE